MFSNAFRWLKPEGTFLFTYSTKEYTGKEYFSGYKKFMNSDLFYDHLSPQELKSELLAIGFSDVQFKYRNIDDETFLWVTVSE